MIYLQYTYTFAVARVKDSGYTLVCLTPNNDITYCREEPDSEAKLVAYIDEYSVRKLNLGKVRHLSICARLLYALQGIIKFTCD